MSRNDKFTAGGLDVASMYSRLPIGSDRPLQANALTLHRTHGFADMQKALELLP
jgi:hypothetical protein